MNAVTDWLIGLLSELKELSQLEQFGIVAAILGAVFATYKVFDKWRVALALKWEKEIESLTNEQRVATAKIEERDAIITSLEVELEGMRSRDPEHLLERSKEEKAAGNEGPAFSLLGHAIEQHEEPLGRAALELTDFHLGMFGGDEAAADQLALAERFARIAHYLLPADREAHAKVAEIESWWGQIKARQGDYARAVRHFDDVYDFTGGADDSDIAPLVAWLSEAVPKAIDEGQYRSAFAFAHRAWVLAERNLPSEHQIRIDAKYYHASVLQLLGRYEEALSGFEAVHAKVHEALGADDRHTLAAAHEIASCQNYLGRYEEALSGFEAVHAKVHEALGEDHPDTLATAHEIAGCQRSLGRYEEALSGFEAVHAKAHEALGADHRHTLAAAHGIGRCQQGLGRYEEALSGFEAVHAKRREVLGDDHPDTLTTAHEIANCQQGLGRYEDALSVFEAVHAKRREVLGEDHPDTLATACEIASCQRSLGRYEEALSVFEAVHAKQRQVLGAGPSLHAGRGARDRTVPARSRPVRRGAVWPRSGACEGTRGAG